MEMPTPPMFSRLFVATVTLPAAARMPASPTFWIELSATVVPASANAAIPDPTIVVSASPKVLR